MKKILQLSLILLISFVSCKVDDPSSKYIYNTNPDYTWGYAEFYGDYYNDYNNTNNIVSMSLFSDSLFINEEGSLDGTGQYLFIEDIYNAPNDTILPEGTYSISTSKNPFTCTKGEFFEVDGNKYRIGSYIYFIEKNSSFSTIKNISSGTFTLNRIGTKDIISCNLTLEDSTRLKGIFKAQLPYIDFSITHAAGIQRKKLQLKHPIE